MATGARFFKAGGRLQWVRSSCILDAYKWLRDGTMFIKSHAMLYCMLQRSGTCSYDMLDPPGAHERGDSFADRSHLGTARPPRAPVGRHYAGPPRSTRKWRQFRRSQPPRDGEASSGPRRTSLCWTSQEPTKVATVSQIAAPQGRRGLI